MTPHSCNLCMGSAGRRRLRKFLLKSPNASTTGAAEELDMGRPYTAKVRREMEGAGCVPRRTVDGRSQRRVERLRQDERRMAKPPPAFVSSRGVPIGSVWIG